MALENVMGEVTGVSARAIIDATEASLPSEDGAV